MLGDFAAIAGIVSCVVSIVALCQAQQNKSEVRDLKKSLVAHQVIGQNGKGVAQSVIGDSNKVAGGDIN